MYMFTLKLAPYPVPHEHGRMRNFKSSQSSSPHPGLHLLARGIGMCVLANTRVKPLSGIVLLAFNQQTGVSQRKDTHQKDRNISDLTRAQSVEYSDSHKNHLVVIFMKIPSIAFLWKGIYVQSVRQLVFIYSNHTVSN